MSKADSVLPLFDDNGPTSSSSLRLQFKTKGQRKPFADIVLNDPSGAVKNKAAELFLEMIKELNDDVAGTNR